jgi:putative ABC transport system permease protein
METRSLQKQEIIISPEAPEMLIVENGSGYACRINGADLRSCCLRESRKFSLEQQILLGKIVKLDNAMNLKVTGVYEDLPY